MKNLVKTGLVICLMGLFSVQAMPVNEQEEALFLTQLKPVKSTCKGSEKTEICINKNFNGNPIILADKTYKNGIGVFANSEIEYEIDSKKYKSFLTTIGIDSETNSMLSSAIFEIYLDDTLVYKSQVFKIINPSANVSIFLNDAKKIRLCVNDAGNGNEFDMADWADARLSTAVTTPSIQQVEKEVIVKLGEQDDSAKEFGFKPEEYMKYTEKFDDDLYVDVKDEDLAKKWRAVQPGPYDQWGNSLSYSYSIKFNLAEKSRKQNGFLTLWILDTHAANPPLLSFEINNKELKQIQTLKGLGGEPTGKNVKGQQKIVLFVPKELLKDGINKISISTELGNWLVYDAIEYAQFKQDFEIMADYSVPFLDSHVKGK